MSDAELESLRMLTNTALDTGSYFALLFIGQPTLRRRLKMAVLATLDQRIGTRFTLNGMTLEDTASYIKAHLGYAGRSNTLFSENAVTSIHRATRGHPWAVNNLAVSALIATYAGNKSIVD